MLPFALVSNSVLVLTAATLFWVALNDFREFKIRNDLVIVLVGLYVVYALIATPWTEILWHVLLAVGMLAIMIYYYSQNLMGGGDVKLLAVAFLWTGPRCALLFAILLAVFVLIHTMAAKYNWVEVQVREKRRRIPLAPAIAGALIGVFMSGCMASTSGFI